MMDEDDEEWLATFNKAHPKLTLSEDAFESIMWRIEEASQEKVPYLETVSWSLHPHLIFSMFLPCSLFLT